MNDTLNQLLGYVPDPPPTLVDNWQTAFVWLALAIIAFAVIALFYGFKQGLQGKHVNKGMLPFIKWPLLFASAGFNVFFTYYVFLPAGQTVAAFSAVVMGGVNLAEAYLVRLIIATWRHKLTVVFRIALLIVVPVFMYSLMAAGSSFSTMMNKNADVQAASQLDLQAAQDRIHHANAQVKEAELGAQKGDLLAALYQTDVRNSQGTAVSFGEVRASCNAGGWYARQYPELCRQYRNMRNGVHTAASVATATTQALATASIEKTRMAQIVRERPPQITPTLLGFALGIAAVGFIVSLALESAIVGVGFFEELFIRPTPLPGLVKFTNKALDWNAGTITQRGLQVDVSPSPGTVNFAKGPSLSNPFSDTGQKQTEPCAQGAGTARGDRAESITAPDAQGQQGDTVTHEQAYQEWLALVRKGQVRPTIPPAKRWISERELVEGIRAIGELAGQWLDRAAGEGVLKPNPEGGQGKPKYVLA
ncbi:MAG: hypothetical protein ACPGSM_18425 [Thiolinea sp.]